MNCSTLDIHELRLIRIEAEKVKCEILQIKRKFEDFLSELDEGYNFDKMSIDEKIIALNTILANIDNLENELNTLELNFHEIELKLKN